MSYTLKIEKKPGYLHATVRGENTKENVMGYLSDVHNACVQRKSSCVLIEENLQGFSLKVTDIFQIASEACKDVAPVLNRVAYVDMNPEHRPEPMKFAENVATNRAINLRIFSNLAEAERWLVETSSVKNN